MGYDVHITRADHWPESDDTPISIAEWEALVKRDPELSLEPTLEAKLPDGRVLRTDSPGMARFKGVVHFLYEEGRVTVTDPDRETIRKMRAIAQALGARVLGDDGECYDESDDGDGGDGGPIIARATPRSEPKAWWRRIRRQ
jgi:hypothetical protein